MKFLRNTLFIFVLAATSSVSLDAMKRKCEEIIVQNQPSYLEEAVSICPDALWLIAQWLEGKSFSSLVQINKTCAIILSDQKIPVELLSNITCADAITHGNVNLTRRFLTSPCGTGLFEKAGRGMLGQPHNAGSCCKFLLGNQQVYSVSKDKNAVVSDCDVLSWIIKGNGSSCCVLGFFSQENILSLGNSQPMQCFNMCTWRDLNADHQDVSNQVGGLSAAGAICGDLTVDQYIAKRAPADALILLFHTSIGQKGADICFIDTTNMLNRERVRFEYFCINMFFIVAAQKNYGAIIEVFLQEESICKRLERTTLMIACDMTTDEVIKEVLKAKINNGNIELTEINS